MDNLLYFLGTKANENASSKGWDVVTPDDWNFEDGKQYKIPAKLALIHAEVSEATEAYRKRDFENFKEELADIVIRTVGLAKGLEIDLLAEVIMKMSKNSERTYKHGGKVL